MRSFTLPELFAQADRVVSGKVEAGKSFWNDAHDTIYTDYVVRTEKTYKGERAETLIVRLMGGKVGDRELVVSSNAVIADGERVLLFLRDAGGFHAVVGMSQGKWSIRTLDGVDMAWRGAALGEKPRQEGEIAVEELIRKCTR